MGCYGYGSNRIHGFGNGNMLYQTQEKIVDSDSGTRLYGYTTFGADIFGEQLDYVHLQILKADDYKSKFVVKSL